MKATVVIPTRAGGETLLRVLTALENQRDSAPREVLLIDSGSPPQEIEQLRRRDVRIHSIEPLAFDHGATRDLGARLGSGEFVVFLNQDAVPRDEYWLRNLLQRFGGAEAPAAVQGGIGEWPRDLLEQAGTARFFWDSCGPRFYFTSESRRWIERHGGIGFSTVNCAIARWAWEIEPFGPAPILEDKSWQARATARGWKIAEAPRAAVWHTHDYALRALVRRCASEGFGWKRIGVAYSLGQALADSTGVAVWREWWRGLRSRAMRRPAEILFPLLRPLALWWGNRWASRVLL